MNGSQYVPFEMTELTKSTRELIIPNDYFNTNDIILFKIANNGNLKSIVIGDRCFVKVRVFELDGLSELESVVIGQQSFRIGNNERNDGSYRIVNCPKLKFIQIDSWSFYDYRSFVLRNLPSLQFIDISMDCFIFAPLFSLTGLIDELA